MKNIILTLTTIITLTSCQSEKDKVVDFVKNQMKDPKSFELVKAEIQDTSHLTDVITLAMLSCGTEAEIYYEEASKSYKDAQIFSTPSIIRSYIYEGDEYRKMGDQWIARRDSLKTQIDKIKSTPKDTLICVNWVVSGYANNSYGQRSIGRFIVHVYPKQPMDMEEYKSEEQLKLNREIELLNDRISRY